MIFAETLFKRLRCSIADYFLVGVPMKRKVFKFLSFFLCIAPFALYGNWLHAGATSIWSAILTQNKKTLPPIQNQKQQANPKAELQNSEAIKGDVSTHFPLQTSSIPQLKIAFIAFPYLSSPGDYNAATAALCQRTAAEHP